MFRINRWNAGAVALLAVFFACAIAAAQGASANNTPAKARAGQSWVLTWNDEFNGPDGSPPDPAKWTIVTGGSGFGNDELEYYTARPANIRQEHGNLVVTAKKEKYVGEDGVSRRYTSARLETKGHFEQEFGRMEARIKLPTGRGVWPAFWAMGNNFDAEGWPSCGEIDIIENIGSEPATVHGSLHGPGYSGGEPLTGSFTLPRPARFTDDFHLFAMEWGPGEIRFYVDDVLYETHTTAELARGQRWVFDHPFFLLLNVAVGGDWPGEPNARTSFPATMLVDYVRVYRRGDDARAGQ